MIELTKDQINKRFDSLPLSLKKAIFDSDNLEILSSLEFKMGLSSEQSALLDKIFSRTLLGFVPFSNLEQEIVSSLKVSPSQASQIRLTLDSKIFFELKNELKELEAKQKTVEAVPSRNVLNLKKPAIFSSKPISQTTPLAPKIISSNFIPQPSPPKPSSSKSNPVQPLKTPTSPFFSSKLPVSNETKISNPPPSPSKVIQRDFIRSTAPAAPFLIHQESKIEPINPPLFSQPLTSKMSSLDSASDSSKPTPEASRPARIEIGETYRHQKKEKEITPAKTEVVKQRVINYGSLPKQSSDPFAMLKKDYHLTPAEEINPKSDKGPNLVGNVVDLKSKK